MRDARAIENTDPLDSDLAPVSARRTKRK